MNPENVRHDGYEGSPPKNKQSIDLMELNRAMARADDWDDLSEREQKAAKYVATIVIPELNEQLKGAIAGVMTELNEAFKPVAQGLRSFNKKLATEVAEAGHDLVKDELERRSDDRPDL